MTKTPTLNPLVMHLSIDYLAGSFACGQPVIVNWLTLGPDGGGLAFDAGDISGRALSDTCDIDVGALPDELHPTWLNDHVTFVVKSFNTPIAWKGDRGWVIPDVDYGPTTTYHQRLVASGLDAYSTL